LSEKEAQQYDKQSNMLHMTLHAVYSLTELKQALRLKCGRQAYENTVAYVRYEFKFVFCIIALLDQVIFHKYEKMTTKQAISYE